MVAVLQWNGPAVLSLTQRQVMAGIDAASMELYVIARKKASVANTGAKGGQKRGAGGRFLKRSKTSYRNSSKPGESPRRRTGAGQRGITRQRFPDMLMARVGYLMNVKYMAYHEVGIRYRRAGFQKRPTIVPAFTENKQAIEAAFWRGASRVS